MEDIKANLFGAITNAKLDYPNKTEYNFNVDGELMVEITLNEYRNLVSDNAKLTAELSFLKGRDSRGEIS